MKKAQAGAGQVPQHLCASSAAMVQASSLLSVGGLLVFGTISSILSKVGELHPLDLQGRDGCRAALTCMEQGCPSVIVT